MGYTVVAEFAVSSKSAEVIAEALSILKNWNPEWNPAFFMSDYSEAEFVAVEQVFHLPIYTFATSTKSRLGNNGQGIISRSLLRKMEKKCLTCYETVRMHRCPVQMKNYQQTITTSVH